MTSITVPSNSGCPRTAEGDHERPRVSRRRQPDLKQTNRTEVLRVRVTLGLACVTLMSTFSAEAGPPSSLACPSGTKHRQLRYGDGKLEEWCIDRTGVRHGPEESRYPNGVLIARDSFVSGQQDGTWVYFFNNGVKWREDQWEFGQLKSSWVNPIVYTLSPEESTALGGVGQRCSVATIQEAAQVTAQTTAGKQPLRLTAPGPSRAVLSLTSVPQVSGKALDC